MAHPKDRVETNIQAALGFVDYTPLDLQVAQEWHQGLPFTDAKEREGYSFSRINAVHGELEPLNFSDVRSVHSEYR